ncbi:MAG: NAD-dependent 4,6-dehydratase LegB [Muribaculaceae bacterium]|nr:NAD-dependent 4,6-dehydratase LegB [Muribaculaceae bacterium]
MIDPHKIVCVTGADGFIGSHLTEMLLSRGFRVRALAQYNSFNYWGWLEDVMSHADASARERLEVVTGDVRDPNFCREFVKGCGTVFHLAALIAIPYSYIAPDSYVATNITGTLNMCQACRDSEVDRLIVTSTSEVYGTARFVPIPETHPRQPQSPYSATKIGADAIALSFFNAFNLPVVVARPFNTYGPRQSARAIIPTIISQIASGKEVIKVGDLTPTRDFNFVNDTCRGFIALAQTPGIEGREINLATGTEISMADTLRTIAEVMGRDVRFEVDRVRLRPSASEVRRLCGDNSLITSLTDWRPEVSLREGLEITARWFSNPENIAKYKVDIYNR